MSKTYPKIGPHSQRGTFKRLDGRGAVARRLKTIRAELTEGAGGQAAMTPAKRILIDTAARRYVVIEGLTNSILTEPEAMAESTIKHLNWLANGLSRDLKLLGLEPRSEPVPELADYIGGKTT